MDDLKKPEEIKINLDNLTELEPVETNYDPTTGDLEDVKIGQSGTPTFIPKKFKEQFYFRNDGKMFVNIDNVWHEVMLSS